MENTQDRSMTSPALQAARDEFEAMREDYLEQQQSFLEATQETARLRETAKALLAEADEANAAWKDMAKERKADQRKINAQIEQAVKLKQQAEGLGTTAEVREELHQSLLLRLAETRWKLASAAQEVNRLFRQMRLAELLETPGLKDVLGEIYALVRFSYKASLSGLDNGRFNHEGKLGAECDQEFLRALGICRIQAAPALACLPAAVKGEVVASTLVGLLSFKEAGGNLELTLEAVMPGATPSKMRDGLQVA